MTEITGIEAACDKMGGQVALADAISLRTPDQPVTQQAVSKWVQKGFAPLDRVPLITELTGIERKRLCDPRILGVIDPD